MIANRLQVLSAVLLLFVVACARCQLTFSPDWGKRSMDVGGNTGSVAGIGTFTQSGNCKTSNEMLLEIFRFVQSQTQHYVDCKYRE